MNTNALEALNYSINKYNFIPFIKFQIKVIKNDNFVFPMFF